MKNTILKLTVLSFFIFGSIQLNAQTDRKASKARSDMKEAEKDLKIAKNDSAEDFLKFKKESEESIADNQSKINELKKKKFENNNEEQQKYDRKMMDLEAKNNKLRKQINSSDDTKTSMWSSFKREFSHDLNELGNAFKDIGVNNEK